MPHKELTQMNDHEYWNQEFELTKSFLKLCSLEVHQHVDKQICHFLCNHPNFQFTEKEKGFWERLIISNPILQRVILYTYSPLEQIELRKKMRAMRGKEMHWDFNYIYFVREDPEIQGSPLLRAFLSKLIEDFDRVTLADIRKLAGSRGALEELRNSCIRYESYHKDESEGCVVGKVIRDESPWCRYEHVIKRYPNGKVKKECHIYVLDDDPRDYFTVADEYLIRWMQAFEKEKQLHESAFSGTMKFYIHDRNGKLITPSGKYKNPFPFALRPKYKHLIEKIHRKYRLDPLAYKKEVKGGEIIEEEDRTDRRWDLGEILRRAIMDWPPKKDVPPPAYFERALDWGFKNLEKGFRKRFIEIYDPEKQRKKSVLKDDFYHGGSLNAPINERDGNGIEKITLLEDTNQDLESNLERKLLLDRFTHPVDRTILIDLFDAIGQPSKDAELARQIKAQGHTVSPQYIGRRKKRIMAILQEIFPLDD